MNLSIINLDFNFVRYVLSNFNRLYHLHLQEKGLIIIIIIIIIIWLRPKEALIKMYAYIHYIIVLVKRGGLLLFGALRPLPLPICSNWPCLDVMNTIESINQLNYS